MQSGRRLTDLEPAGLARRTSAFAIDWALASVIVVVIYQLVLQVGPGLIPSHGADRLLYALVVFWVTFLLYFAIFESRAGHATPGKRLLRIDVASVSTPSLSFGRALLRNVAKFFPALVAHLFLAAYAHRVTDPATGTLTIPALDALGAGVLGGLLLALVLLGVLLFSVMLHPDGRGAHDMLAGTFVVRSIGDALPGASASREAALR